VHNPPIVSSSRRSVLESEAQLAVIADQSATVELVAGLGQRRVDPRVTWVGVEHDQLAMASLGKTQRSHDRLLSRRTLICDMALFIHAAPSIPSMKARCNRQGGCVFDARDRSNLLYTLILTTKGRAG
jgi:hypothetical protein